MGLHTKDFDYALPPELIAQDPAPLRDGSRLMVLNRTSRHTAHRRFTDICHYLGAGDLLVLNRSRVIPARLHGRKSTGGEVELLLLRPAGPATWTVLAMPSRRLRSGAIISLNGGSLQATLDESLGDGIWNAHFRAAGDVAAAIRRAGSVPLPPYITRSTTPLDRYQTIYADRDGSVAAPTAGLHFTEQLLTSIRQRGVDVRYVTLHVGLGTFRPVVADHVEKHQMLGEWGEITAEVALAVNRIRAQGGRIIAVGTTTTRLLESAIQGDAMAPFRGDTDRFIYPGYRFAAVDVLLTNFHLPRSTLLMLVSAFAGREFVLEAYREAVEQRYRFYSYGDAMLIT